jgi:hypothetical protein
MQCPIAFLCSYQFFGNVLYLVGMALGMNYYKSYDLKPGGLAKYGHVAGRGKIKGLNGFAYLLATGFEPADDAFLIKGFIGRNDKFRRWQFGAEV